MATIKVMKWNAKKLEMVGSLYEIPTNVLNTEAFRSSVQTACDYFTYIRLSNALESKEKAMETLNKKETATTQELDNAYKEYKEAEEQYSAFKKTVPAVVLPTDKFATAYVMAVVGISASIEVQDFYDTYVAIIRYAHDYQFAGVQKWTENRKTAFTAVKDAVNDSIAMRFRIKEQTNEEKEAGTELTYKPFDPNFNVKETERIVSAVYGKIDTAKGNTKTCGTALRHMTEEQAFTYITREMFHKYGCEVDTRKVKKVAFIF